MTGQAWRVRPLNPPRLAVQIDAWYELPINPPSPTVHRVDLIVERETPEGRTYRIITGTQSPYPVRPATPEGWTPIATVLLPCATQAVMHAMISDV